jgi:hypothetical protein
VKTGGGQSVPAPGREMSGYKRALVERRPMSEPERVWLVEREYSDKGLVTLVYATTGGERAITQQRSQQMLTRMDVTAATDVEPDRLEPVEDDDRRERYAHEAQRMAERHDPEEAV